MKLKMKSSDIVYHRVTVTHDMRIQLNGNKIMICDNEGKHLNYATRLLLCQATILAEFRKHTSPQDMPWWNASKIAYSKQNICTCRTSYWKI